MARDQPRTGNGYSENREAKKNLELDQRFKKLQRDFEMKQPENKSFLRKLLGKDDK